MNTTSKHFADGHSAVRTCFFLIVLMLASSLSPLLRAAEQPEWADFRKRNIGKRKPIMTEGDPTYNYEYDVIKFSAKVFAMCDAAEKCDTDMLYYLDSDTYTFDNATQHKIKTEISIPS